MGLLPVGAYVAIVLAWLALLVVSAAAHVGVFRASRAAIVALPFALAAFPLVFTRPEDPLGTFNAGFVTLTVSGEGLRIFLSVMAKSWLSVQAALLLAFTTPFHDLVDALRRLHLPGVLVSVISFMYRYMAVLSDEAGRMLRARAARMADPDGRGGGSLRWRARVAGGLVGSLFLRAYERSERIYAAMQARGFEGQFVHAHGRAMTRSEVVALAGGCLVLAAYVALAHLVLRT